jgi:prolyl-tRNA editing enzyme YbaK/EbsC (Cys-tRNA(Pro) deacylase)
VWPEPVERIAALLRAAGVPGRIEQLPAGVDDPPGPALRTVGFDCDGRGLVVLVPANRDLDRDKLSSSAGCGALRPAPLQPFPFKSARVFLDRSALTARTLWLEAGSTRHFLGLAPSQLARVTRLETADLLLED